MRWTPAAIFAAAVAALVASAHSAVGGFPLSVRDATGAVVAIPEPPRRIISLAPSVTEILFALGLDREIVGLSDADDYPPDRVRGKPRVGGVVINLERAVALRPDLVVGMASLQADQIARLRAVRLRVLAVDAESVAETVEQVRLLGRVTGRVKEGETLARSIEQQAQGARPTSVVRVYIEVWHEPVLAAADGTLVDDLTRRAGGQNIFQDRRGYVQVSMESVLVRNPQVVFLLYPGRAALIARPGWRAIEAGRAGRVHELPPDLVTRPGPRVVDGLALVLRLLRDGR